MNKRNFAVNYQIDGNILSTSATDDNITLEVVEGERSIITLTAKNNIVLRSATVSYDHPFKSTDRIFANGYQSWTDSREFSINENLRNIYKLPKKLVDLFAFDMYGDAYFKTYHKGVIHGFDVGYVRGNEDIFIGSYNANNAYLIINAIPKRNEIILESDVCGLALNSGEKIVLFDYVIAKNGENYFSTFKPRTTEKLFGYTSWYNYYQDINEENITKNLQSIDKRFDLFQIDDGFESYVGDWLDIDKKKFPNGLKGIVEEIHQKGFKAGVWLAPFAAETKSKTFNEHKDWFLQKNGEPVKAGSNWSGFYALDIYNEEVREYIKKFLTYYVSLGFDFFKLDFLYAVALATPNNKTRAQVTSEAYALLREVLGDKLILGCGGVMSNACQTFDYMRVGPDISLIFDDVFYMRPMHRERISTKRTLQNSVYRSIFDGKWFLSDPDVFLLRDDNIKLSKKQRKAVATINAIFGSILMTSDNIAEYDEEKKCLLERVITLFNGAYMQGYECEGNEIEINYTLENKPYKITYNVKRGELNE